jgi:predicted Zn-dependent protease
MSGDKIHAPDDRQRICPIIWTHLFDLGIFMKFATLLFICVVSISAYSRPMPQVESLALKSQQAKELMAEGKFQQAIALYRELNEAVPNNPGLKLNLGMALHMVGRKREAIPELEQAVKLDPQLAPAWLFLGTTRLQLGEATASLKPLRTVLQLQPHQHEARQMLADALLSLDRLEDASAEYHRLAGEDPENVQAWYGLGRTYELLSSATFEKLQKLAPESAYVLSLLAEARLREQQFSSAFYLYRRALERMPNLHGLHSAVAEIYRQSGHPEWAEIEQHRETALPAPDCTSRTLECHFISGEYDDLIAAAKSAKTPESLYWTTRAYNELALTSFDRLGQFPPSPELHELKAHIYNNQKKYSEAAAEWRKALELLPADLRIKKNLALSLKFGEDYSAALPLFQELLHQQPDSAEFNYFVGDTLLDLQRSKEALPLLKRAVLRDPKSPAAHKALARCELAIGEPAKAIPHLKLVLASDEDGSLHYQLAQAYRANGQIELSRKMLRDYESMRRSIAARNEAAKQETNITEP